MTFSNTISSIAPSGMSEIGGMRRQTIRVCAPAAHMGIGDALRRAFTPPTGGHDEAELIRLLERV